MADKKPPVKTTTKTSTTKAPVKKKPVKKKPPIKVEITLPPPIEKTLAQKIDELNPGNTNVRTEYIDVDSIRRTVANTELNEEKENVILYNADGETIDLSNEKEKSI